MVSADDAVARDRQDLGSRVLRLGNSFEKALFAYLFALLLVPGKREISMNYYIWGFYDI